MKNLLQSLFLLSITLCSPVVTLAAANEKEESSSNNDNNNDNNNALVLAKCPTPPAVQGYFYNNGRVCVRDKQTWNRTVLPATCPDDGYELVNAWCRKRFHHKRQPVCDNNNNKQGYYQLYQRGGKAECQSPCPDGTTAYNGICIQPTAILSTQYMTCPDDDDNDSAHSHRVGAYCCSMALGNCPKPQCHMDPTVPGKFYYNPHTALCERQVQYLARSTVPKVVVAPAVPNNPKKKKHCPAGTVPVRSNACQDPCPVGYRASRGKCILPYCAFDTTRSSTTNGNNVVVCPEGTYSLAQDLY